MKVFAVVATLATLLGTLSARAQSSTEAPKVFVGPQGEQAVLVPLPAREPKQYLLRVQGTGSVLDGLVFPATVKDWSSQSTARLNYTIPWHGRTYAPLVTVGTRTELHFPGGPGNGLALQYDEARSQKLKPEELQTQHQQQTKSGQLEKLMAFDRKGEQATHDTAYAEALQALNTRCATAAKGAIDWATVTDALLKDADIGRLCVHPLTAMKALCDVSEEARRTVKARIQRFDCRLGAGLEPDLQGDRFVWTTAPGVSNPERAATRYFKKHL